MHFSRLFCPTLKEDPKEAETASHRLMLRGGMIRQLASGIYSLLPVGLRVIRKVETIVRDHLALVESHNFQELGPLLGKEVPITPQLAELREAVLELSPRVVSFHFGLPDPDMVRAIKDAMRDRIQWMTLLIVLCFVSVLLLLLVQVSQYQNTPRQAMRSERSIELVRARLKDQESRLKGKKQD